MSVSGPLECSDANFRVPAGELEQLRNWAGSAGAATARQNVLLTALDPLRGRRDCLIHLYRPLRPAEFADQEADHRHRQHQRKQPQRLLAGKNPR